MQIRVLDIQSINKRLKKIWQLENLYGTFSLYLVSTLLLSNQARNSKESTKLQQVELLQLKRKKITPETFR